MVVIQLLTNCSRNDNTATRHVIHGNNNKITNKTFLHTSYIYELILVDKYM